MKKLLLATSAIILMAGTALADAHSSGISVSGSGNFGVKFSEDNDLQFHHEFDIKFSASGTTDGGLGFGAEVAIDNTEGISATTNTSVTDGDIGVMQGTTGAQSVRNRIDIAYASAGTLDACYLYNGRTITGANLASAVRINNGVLDDDTTDSNGNDADGEPAPISVNIAPFMDNGEVADALANEDVSVTLVEDVVAELEITGESFWKSEEGMNVVVHKVSASDGNMFANCNSAGNGAAFNVGSLYSPVSDVTGTSAMQSDTMASSSTSGSVSNHATVYISLDNHKLSIGSDMDAADKLAGGLAEVGFDGVGVDDAAESIYGKTGKDIRYDGTFGLAKVALSYGDEEWAAGFSFDVAPIRVGAGFDSKGVASIGLGIKQGQISGNIFYSTDSDTNDDADGKPDATGMGLDMTYQMSDATSVTLAFGRHEAMSMSKDAFGVGFSHNLGGGATLAAGVASVDSMTKADLGIKMSF